MPSETKYWPYEVLPVEQQTPSHQDEIRFLQTAHAEGMASYRYGRLTLGATGPNGRNGEIVARARGSWEVILNCEDDEFGSGYVNDFNIAAVCVLRWLHGEDAEHLLTELQFEKVSLPVASATAK